MDYRFIVLWSTLQPFARVNGPANGGPLHHELSNLDRDVLAE